MIFVIGSQIGHTTSGHGTIVVVAAAVVVVVSAAVVVVSAAVVVVSAAVVVVVSAAVVVVVSAAVVVVVCVWQFVKSAKTFGTKYSQMHTLTHAQGLFNPSPVDASQKIGTVK